MLKRIVGPIMQVVKNISTYNQNYFRSVQQSAFYEIQFKPKYLLMLKNKNNQEEFSKINYLELIHLYEEEALIELINNSTQFMEQSGSIALQLPRSYQSGQNGDNLANFYKLVCLHIETCAIYYAFEMRFCYTELDLILLEDITSNFHIKALGKYLANSTSFFRESQVSKLKFEYICRIVKILLEGEKIPLKKLHSLMKQRYFYFSDQFDCLEKIKLDAEENDLKEMILYEKEASITFNFFIAKVLLQRGDEEEYWRFLKQGLQQLQQYIIFSQEKQNYELQREIVTKYFSIIIQAGIKMLRDPNKDFIGIEMFYNFVFIMLELVDGLSVQLVREKLNFCQYLIQKEKVPKAFLLLESLQNKRDLKVNGNLEYMFLTICHSAMQPLGNQQDETLRIQRKIEKMKISSLDFRDCKLYGIKYHKEMFFKEIAENRFENLQMRIDIMLECQKELFINYPTRDEKQIHLPIFPLIEEIINNPNLPQRNQYLSQIYHLFKSLYSLALGNESKEFHIDYYCISLGFVVMEQEKLNEKECFEELDRFVIYYLNQIEYYQSCDEVLDLFLMKTQNIFYFLLENTQHFSVVKQHINTILKIIDQVQDNKINKNKLQEIYLEQLEEAKIMEAKKTK